MKTSLDIDDQKIIATVNNLFPIAIKELEFLPIGESSWMYVDKNQSVAVKVAQMTVDNASSEVLGYLSRKGFSWMPQIIMSKNGNLWEKSSDLYYSAQQYIESEIMYGAGDNPNDDYLLEVGSALHDLHSIRVDYDQLKNVPRENFVSEKGDDAHMAIERLMSTQTSDNLTVAIQSRISNLSVEIGTVFDNLIKFGNELAAQNNEFVICHGDFHLGNILNPRHDHLYIVDWDEVRIALPEFDLKYFSDDQISTISEGYGRELPINELALKYYRNNLVARALWFWISAFLGASTTDRQSVADTISEIFDTNSPYIKRAIG